MYRRAHDRALSLLQGFPLECGQQHYGYLIFNQTAQDKRLRKKKISNSATFYQTPYPARLCPGPLTAHTYRISVSSLKSCTRTGGSTHSAQVQKQPWGLAAHLDDVKRASWSHSWANAAYETSVTASESDCTVWKRCGLDASVSQAGQYEPVGALPWHLGCLWAKGGCPCPSGFQCAARSSSEALAQLAFQTRQAPAPRRTPQYFPSGLRP